MDADVIEALKVDILANREILGRLVVRLHGADPDWVAAQIAQMGEERALQPPSSRLANVLEEAERLLADWATG
jgi:hypothetical protein